jgi:TPR repeat protein
MTRLSSILLCGLVLIAGRANAVDFSAIKASPARVTPGAEVKITVDLSESSRCGVLFNFGDGSTQELKIESAKSGTVAHSYQQPGNYTVTVQGKTIWRGLKTFSACDSTIEGIEVSVEAAGVVGAGTETVSSPGMPRQSQQVAGTTATQTALSDRTDEARSSTRGVGSGQAKPLVSPVSTGNRIALVIGNDAYQNVTKLEKAGNDATAMARELRVAGFKVLEHRDLNYRGMVKAVEALVSSITGGDQVVVFFSGHGVQLKTGNYLLPTDIEAHSESEIEKMAYGLDDLTEKLNSAKPSFTLVMVDACRDNPTKGRGTKSIGGTRGLSPIEPPKGQMVIYSASKGQQALDRMDDADKNPNGVFTREFIARMKRPGVKIEELVREVQDAVEELAKSISHEQRPAIYNEARGNFYFYGPTTVQTAPQGGGASAAPVRVRTPEEIEDSFWDRIKDDREAVGFEEYLKQYPKGRYAGQARLAVSKLSAEAEKQKLQREKAEREKQEAGRLQREQTEARRLIEDDGDPVKRYRKAADQGDADAQYTLGIMYRDGNRVGKDAVEAVNLYRKAAEQGHLDAQVILGRTYGRGDSGTRKDVVEAVKWYRKAAEQGHAISQYNLGNTYRDGVGVGKDAAEAVKWYRKAAEQGHADAQGNLGVQYAKGDGVTQDAAEAVKWYRKAAEQGIATAQFNLGNTYRNGKGVERDAAEAVKWYRKAAEQGIADAQNNLGVAYSKGFGVEKDDVEALKWYKKAAENGSEAAQGNLRGKSAKDQSGAADNR